MILRRSEQASRLCHGIRAGQFVNLGELSGVTNFIRGTAMPSVGSVFCRARLPTDDNVVPRIKKQTHG